MKTNLENKPLTSTYYRTDTERCFLITHSLLSAKEDNIISQVPQHNTTQHNTTQHNTTKLYTTRNKSIKYHDYS